MSFINEKKYHWYILTTYIKVIVCKFILLTDIMIFFFLVTITNSSKNIAENVAINFE